MTKTPEQEANELLEMFFDKIEDIENSELVGFKTMKWVDDGKHNISINVSLADNQSS